MAEVGVVLAAGIAKLRHRPENEQKDFQNRLEVLRKAFRMRMPEARMKAETLRDRYIQKAVNFERRIDLMKDRARRYICRAEKIGDILEANKNRNLTRARHNATPETLVKPRARDPITMLVEKGKLDNEQERAAREIARIRQAVVVALVPKIGTLDRAQSPKRGVIEDRMPEEIAMLRHDRYLPWSTALAGKDDISLPLVIDVAVDGVSVNRACRHRRIGYARGVRLIGEALALYNKYRWGTSSASSGVDGTVRIRTNEFPA